MKDLDSKPAVMCPRGSEKLRFDIKRRRGSNYLRKKTTKQHQQRQADVFVRTNGQSLLLSKRQVYNYLLVVICFFIDPSYTKLLSSQSMTSGKESVF